MSDSPVFVTAAEANPGIEHARAAGIGTPLLCEIIARNTLHGVVIDVEAIAREAYDAGARGIGAAPVVDEGDDIDSMGDGNA
jgi:hypothetical protein